MRNIIIFLLIVFIFSQIEAQKNQRNIFNADELATSVINLRKPNDKDREKIGTGSFISKGEDFFIVTASHVSKYMYNDAYIIFQGDNNSPEKIELNKLTNHINWQDHPIADLSVLKLNPESIFKYNLYGRFIPFEMIDTFVKSIPRNTQLTIIGFPLGLGANGFISPLTYRTFPSSGLITLNRADTHTPQTFIILENPSIAGYSGGPVYDLSIVETGLLMMSLSGTKLHGFIHGTISDETGGKLSTITPAFYLKDLIK